MIVCPINWMPFTTVYSYIGPDIFFKNITSIKQEKIILLKVIFNELQLLKQRFTLIVQKHIFVQSQKTWLANSIRDIDQCKIYGSKVG